MRKSAPPTRRTHAYCDSPVGSLLLASIDGILTLISFPEGIRALDREVDGQRDDAGHATATQQLTEYFDGKRLRFDLPFRLFGTEFQKTVWQYLATIPYGTTVSYGECARQIGHPNASRAVGAANGANPLPIVLPCHRVIGSNGSLTGFGGGLETKRWLLAHEYQHSDRQQRQFALL